MGNEAANPFMSGTVVKPSSNALAESDQQRAIAEVQTAMVIAKRFPRNPIESMDRILMAFARPTLAEMALYSYAKGGTEISDLSIRAAETIAQGWGNFQFGIRELEQRNGESTVEAFAWDMETNAKQVKVFQVPHVRYTKKGTYRLEDPREIYELVANQGARRLRACILGVIPADVKEAAKHQAETTLATKAEVTPERINSLIGKFAEFSVTKEQIEKRIQRRIDALTPALMVQLGKIYNSLRDGMSASGDWFEMPAPVENATASQTQSVKDKMRAKKGQTQDVADGEKPEAKPDGKPAPTYALLVERFQKARDVDLLDADADLLREIPDEEQRQELEALYQARRKALTEGAK